MGDLPGPPVGARHARARAALDQLNLDLLIVSSLPNVFYLSGFAASAALFLLGHEQAWLGTDARYASAAEQHLERNETGATLVVVRETYDQTLLEFLKSSHARRIGFEAEHMTVARHTWLCASLGLQDGPHDGRASSGVQLVPTEGLVEQLRAVKDGWEIALLKDGARRLSALVDDVVEEVRPDRLEREVAASIEWLLRDAGFSRPAFPTIVASGPNTALPHARAGERALEAGDLVMLDFGGVYGEYCVDLTRMVSLGTPDSRARETHAAVLEAQEAAMATVKPGVAAFSVDQAARDALQRRGLADAFVHGTGHGLGIEVHEAPRISRLPKGDSSRAPLSSSAVTLETNMIFTVEPGVYVAGWGGVRIEDDVLVTPQGCEVLTDVMRELIVR